MASDRNEALRPAEAQLSPEESCEMWDWARTAGVSREELLRAIEQESPSSASPGSVS